MALSLPWALSLLWRYGSGRRTIIQLYMQTAYEILAHILAHGNVHHQGTPNTQFKGTKAAGLLLIHGKPCQSKKTVRQVGGTNWVKSSA